jgi:hypothetical protein
VHSASLAHFAPQNCEPQLPAMQISPATFALQVASSVHSCATPPPHCGSSTRAQYLAPPPQSAVEWQPDVVIVFVTVVVHA